MPLICFASQKGSPGTSAAALAVAAAFRPGEGRRKLLLEADLSGGALAIRYRLPSDPGLVTLAAAARAGLTPDELWRHACELPGGLPAIVCPDGPEQVHSALAAAGALLGRHLAERRDLDVIADLGRLQPGSPAVELAAEATAVLMVARPEAEQLQPAAQRMLALRPRIKNLGWLLVGEKPHGPAEVESTFGFPVVGVLADDRRSVEAIEGGAVTRRVRRHPFVRSAATVAGTLGTWLAPLASAPVESEDASSATTVGPSPQELSTTPASVPEQVPEADAPSVPETSPTPSDTAAPTERPVSSEPAPAVEPPPQPEPIDHPVLGPAPPPGVSAPPPRESAPPPRESAPARESAPSARSNGHHRSAAPSAPSPGHEPATAEALSVEPATVEPPPAELRSSEPSLTEIDPPALPAPPLPPPRVDERATGAPDPFVHGDDDVEWTGS